MWMFYAVVGVAAFATLAMMVREGLWSNTITLANIIFSGLVAFGFYGPLVIWVDEMLDGEYTYLLDFILIWALYVVTMIVARLPTDWISRTRLRLKHPLDPIGGPVMAILGAFVMASFVAATLHTAPLADDAMDGALQHTKAEVEGDKSSLTSPDLFWLRLVQQLGVPSGFGREGAITFDAASFVKIYGEHRKALKNAPGLTVHRS